MDALDNIDRGLLDLLQQDGRLSNAKLAERFNLSETSCWRRLKQLEGAGLIEGYRAALNRRKLGFGVLAFVQITCNGAVSEAAAAEFETVIQTTPNILACHNTTGEADFLLEVVAEDIDEYYRFLEKLVKKLPAVKSIRSNISLRQLKSTHRLPIV